MPILLDIFASVLVGAVLGSFGSCFAYRYSVGQTVLSPSRSYCPNCDHKLHWFDNLPLVSYAILRGECRYCGEEIGRQYLVFELLMLAFAVGFLLCTESFFYWIIMTMAAFLLVVSVSIENRVGRVPRFVPIGVAFLAVAMFASRQMLPAFENLYWFGAGVLAVGALRLTVFERFNVTSSSLVLIAVTSAVSLCMADLVMSRLTFVVVWGVGVCSAPLSRPGVPAVSVTMGIMCLGSMVVS